jgi:hypothetical protein
MRKENIMSKEMLTEKDIKFIKTRNRGSNKVFMAICTVFTVIGFLWMFSNPSNINWPTFLFYVPLTTLALILEQRRWLRIVDKLMRE